MKLYGEQGKERAIRDTKAQFGVRKKTEIQNEHDWIEWQANAFASAVLMPRSLVIDVAERTRRDDMSDLMFLNQVCAVAADVFRVSVTAAFYRMKELGIAPEESRMVRNGIIVRM